MTQTQSSIFCPRYEPNLGCVIERHSRLGIGGSTKWYHPQKWSGLYHTIQKSSLKCFHCREVLLCVTGNNSSANFEHWHSWASHIRKKMFCSLPNFNAKFWPEEGQGLGSAVWVCRRLPPFCPQYRRISRH